MKIEIPITAVSDSLFDSKVKEAKREEYETLKEELCREEMEKLNREEKEKYSLEHPTIGDILNDLKKK